MAKKKSQSNANVLPENKTMSIHMVKGGYPPFHELGEYIFQDLSAELLAEEPGIIAAGVYGIRGQKQYGIDVLAASENDEIEVGQCKRYQAFSQQDVIDASNEFFEHWDAHWKSKKVRRFVLFVACRVTETQSVDEIDRQKAWFKQHGIQYELWGAEKIEQKLRPHFQIVSKFCDPSDHWVKKICGEAYSGIPSKTSSQYQAEISVNLTFASQLAEFASQAAEKELQGIRALWQQGNENDALARLEQVKRDTKIWANASPELKARIVCFGASIALETGEDVSAVEKLLNEAHSYAQVVSEKRVRALLLVRDRKNDDALRLLANEDDVDTANLRATLLLDAGQDDTAIGLLTELMTKGIATAETYRLMALSNLARRNIAQANEYIKQAKEKEPNWFRIQVVEGMIAYFQALSPIAVPDRLIAFPLPIDWILIKQDEESITSLRVAEKIFAQLAANTQRIGKETYFPAWRLACLFSDAERQEDAIALCTSLLVSDPGYFPALAWAAFRRLDVDLKPSIELLEKEISDPNVPINNIFALLNLYEYTERIADGLHLLETTRDRFEQQHAMEAWATNYIRLLINSNDSDEIEAFAATLPEGDEYLVAWRLIASYRAAQSGQSDEFITHQLGLFQQTQEPEFLLDACMALYRNKKWEEFAQYADILIEKIGTIDIHRHVIHGVYNAHHYERCLALIEEWEQEFHIEQTQQEFRQMRVSCFHALGNYEKALTEAKTLVDNNPSITNILQIIHLLYEMGNYDAVAGYAESLKDADLHPETLLRLAYLLRGNHTPLAQFFWRKAVANELTDEYTGTAIDLAFKLELENEIGNLFQRLLSYDGKEKQAIQRLQTRQEVTQTFDSLRQVNAEYENAYRSGVLPIHFYAEGLNLTFSDLFHDELKEKRGDELVWSHPLYIRYGGRPLIDGFPQPIDNLRLFVDISALLLSAHLGVLDRVEQAFSPLYIPSEIFASLTSMVDRTYHHQPSVIKANKTIVRLVSRKKLKVVTPPQLVENGEPDIAQLSPEWRECFALAKARGGYFLTFLPPTKLGEVYISEPIHLSADKVRNLINCRTLADALRDKEELTKDQYTAALEGLGTLAEVYPNTQQPHQQAFIICDDSVIDSLARTGLLERACTVFDVYITQRRFEIAQGATSRDTDREEARKWLQALQERLRTGLQEQRYIALPVREDDDERANTTSSVLLALIKHAETLQETDAVWIDDRFTNHYNRVGKASLIGIVDILKLLVGKQLLSPESYYERLIQLRAGNVRFIPLQPDELLYHLKNALKQEDGKYWIEETRSLTVIRRSIAACITNRKDIQLPPVPKQITHQQGEVEFLLSLHHVIQQALHEIWLSVPQSEARETLADWLIVHLYLDYPSLILKEKEQRPIDQPDYYRAGAQLAGFLSLAYFQLRNEAEEAALYQHYIEWVVSRIIGRRLHTEPELLEASANVIKQTLVHVKNENMNEYPEELVGSIIYRYIRSLPDILQSKIESDETFLRELGAETTPIITIDDLHFERDEFWQAVTTVVNGGKKAIRTTNMDAIVRFSPFEEQGTLIVCIDHPQRDEQIGLNYAEFSILSSSPEEREHFLKGQRHTFDCSDSEFQQIIDELQSITDSTQRVLRLLALWTESAAVIYRDLARDTRPNKPLNIPSLTDIHFQSLQHYLRLVSGSDTAPSIQGIEQGASQLIQELGIEPTFFRFSGLPGPLPQTLIDALDAMPSGEREELLKRGIRSPRSIPSTIHLLRLLCRYQADAPVLKEAADQLTGELCGEAAQVEVEAFLALLIWVHRQFLLRTEFAGLTTQLKIVVTWTHTHHLFSILKANRIDFAWIQKIFANEASRMSVEVLLQDQAYRSDIAHPRFVSYERLVLTGLLYAVNGETPFLPPRLTQRIIDLAFPLVQGEHRFPAIFLSLNPAFLANVSNSFLNRNMGEELAPLVEGMQPDQFSNEALTDLIDQFIGRIQDNDAGEPEKAWSWAILYFAVQDIALPPEHTERLTELFLTLDWVNLFTEQYVIWRVAFLLAVLRYPSSTNEVLKQNLQVALYEITKICSEMEQASGALDGTKRSEIIGALLEGAIRLAVDPRSGEVVLETFSTMVIEMSWRWRFLGTEIKRVVQVMCEDLPLPYAQQLWSTLVMLRAM